MEQDPGPIAKLQSTAYSFAVLRASPRFFNSLHSTVTVYNLKHSLRSQNLAVLLSYSLQLTVLKFRGPLPEFLTV